MEFKKGKGLLDRPGVRERINKKVEEVKKMYFDKGLPLSVGECVDGEWILYDLYEDGRKIEVKRGKL